MKIMVNNATASMNRNNGAFSSGQSKRKHEVIDLTADDDVVDLTGSPIPASKVRKGSDFKLGSAETSYRFPGGFRINPIKTEQGASSSSVKQELGYESAPRFEPTTPRRDFSIRSTNSERQRNSSIKIKSEVRGSNHPIFISSPTPPVRRTLQQKECTICYETFDTDVLPLRPHVTATADHTVCYGCWEKHLHSELERKEWDRLSCPDCGETMSVADICGLDVYFQERIEPKIMDKAAKSCLDQDPDWVDCPSGTCKSGALMTEGHIFTCQECLYRFCFSCKIPMHEGEACSEYHERLRREPEKLREEELSTKKVDEVSKGCPGCTARIQKNDGCDHMTCRRCKHEFCWICLADYGGPNGVNVRGNDAHLDSCRYASRRLPDYRGPRL